MKNTTFRKKALLSSVAMLLVALVALGSATFAWFTANPNADASGLSVKTTAASGLVIKTATEGVWSHNAIFNAAKDDQGKLLENADKKHYTDPSAFDLQPVAQDQTTPANFLSVEAADSASYEKGDGTINTGVTSGFYKEVVSFRLSDGSAPEDEATIQLKGVTINPYEYETGKFASMAPAIRVAITDCSGNLIGTYAYATGSANGVLLADGQTGSFTGGLNVAPGADKLSVNVYEGKLTANEADAKSLTVYVYLDGQDSTCYSDNVGTINAEKIIESIDIDFKLV